MSNLKLCICKWLHNVWKNVEKQGSNDFERVGEYKAYKTRNREFQLGLWVCLTYDVEDVQTFTFFFGLPGNENSPPKNSPVKKCVAIRYRLRYG